MNIKSLLIGSAAALAVVSGAQAADAIVAAEPEPMEYVRVCDAFGTGYFYIPGTETCLRVSGTLRFQVDFGDDTYDNGVITDDWDMRVAAWVDFSAKSDTELGTLESFITIEDDISIDGTGHDIYFDSAYIALGGFKAGWFYSWWDDSIKGETDDLGDTTEFLSASYTYSSDAFSVGISLDELELGADHDIGLTGMASAAFGPATFTLLGSYDFANEEGAIRGIVAAEVGPGTLSVAGLYASGENVYWDQADWSIAASYALKATDQLVIIPAVQYRDGLLTTTDEDSWTYGITLDYTPVENLLARLTVNYDDVSEDFSGYFRLQRSF
ncbi:porin [Pseudomonas sp. R2.Fl]|nr:porin [Pseudomonas sp. R2.Fl]